MASPPGTGSDGAGGADSDRQPDEADSPDAEAGPTPAGSAPVPGTAPADASAAAAAPDDLPADGPSPDPVTGQTCAFCGCRQVVWVHPLATDRVLFRRFGKDDVVSSFWGLCEPCEQLYQSGRDDELIALMKSAGGWVWQGTEVDDVLRKPVAVFREADLGRRPISG